MKVGKRRGGEDGEFNSRCEISLSTALVSFDRFK